jgi:glycerol-1-phosphate dehydrogenase [NAD(P)+]
VVKQATGMSGHPLPDPTDVDGLRRRLGSDTTGRRHAIGLGRVVLGPEALEDLETEVEAIRRPGPVVVLQDETSMRRGADDLKALVAERLTGRFETRLVTLTAHDTELHADADALAQADRVVAGAGCVVALGSGTVADIAKDATFRADGAPLLLIQTAVSVNAFSDDMAVLLRDGVKRTVPSRWPDTLLIDLAVIADAPAAMNRAGFGELCSMFTAPADWYLARALGMDDTYDPAVVDLFRDGADGLLEGADRVRTNDPAMLAELAGRMTLTGIAMGVAGRTAPLSGTEHLLSHLLDMAAGAAGRPLAFHGAQVGVAALLAATLWADTLERWDPARLADPGTTPDRDRLRARVHETFQPLDPTGRMAAECWRDVEAKLDRWSGTTASRATAARDWPSHRSDLAALVTPPATLAAALRAAGAASTADALDPPPDLEVLRWAVRALPFMRERFTVADLHLFTGTWTDAVADDLLERSGILAAAVPGR